MLLQPRGDFAKLVVDVRHDLLQFENRHRRAHARNHIFALRIHQKFAIKLFRAGRRITREPHARSAGVAQVAIHHGLHIDRGPEQVVDVVDAAIVLGAVVLPGAEYRVPRHDQLFAGILREVTLGVLLHHLLVLDNHFLESLGIEIGVEFGLLLFLLGVEHFVERRLLDVEHYVAEHLDEPSIGISGKPRIAAAPGQRFHALVVQPEVENRVHHPGHGELRARTHAHQQRVFARAQLLPLQGLQLRQRLVHLAINFFRHAAASHVLPTSLGLNRKSRRHGQSGIRHLGQSGAFAAEHLLHLAVAVGLAAAEEVNILGGGLLGFLRFNLGESNRRHR